MRPETDAFLRCQFEMIECVKPAEFIAEWQDSAGGSEAYPLCGTHAGLIYHWFAADKKPFVNRNHTGHLTKLRIRSLRLAMTVKR